MGLTIFDCDSFLDIEPIDNVDSDKYNDRHRGEVLDCDIFCLFREIIRHDYILFIFSSHGLLKGTNYDNSSGCEWLGTGGSMQGLG